MKIREFNKHLKSISDRKTKLIDISKISNLSDEIRKDMVDFIVRKRVQIIKDLIPFNYDMKWLQSCGYLYETKGKNYTFIHTSENKIK